MFAMFVMVGLLCGITLTAALNLNPFRNNAATRLKSSLLKSSEPIATPSRCNLFRSSPEIRKVVKVYIHNKILGESEGDAKVFCDRGKIFQILNQVIPPVRHDEVTAEVNNLIAKFGDRFFLEEREFTSKILMDNEIWAAAGETVVKELVYMDNKYHEEIMGKPYLSNSCADLLEASLAEDESPILNLSPSELRTASELINTLNYATCEGDQVSVQPNPITEYGHIPFLNDKYKLHDCYGNPTLLQYISDRTSSREAGAGASAEEQSQLDFLDGKRLYAYTPMSL
jgi:hypothetical protein